MSSLLARMPSTRVLGALIVLCIALADQVLLAGIASADEFQQPCTDVGRFSDSPAPSGPGYRVLFCDTSTHTWFIFARNPSLLTPHGVGTSCGLPYDEGRTEDGRYLLTCINSIWVPGS